MGSEKMKLIVGLGNPGNEYINTRHNIGFKFIDQYLNYKKIDLNWKNKFNGLYLKYKNNKDDVIFLKPQTFMNLSGDCVKKFIDYFNIDISDVLVISDDLDLNIGNFKLKLSGSSGGHNGLKDISQKISTNDYKRLKIGISNNKLVNTKDYVLGIFNSEEINTINNLFNNLNYVLDDYFVTDFEKLMNKYNKKNK